MVATLAEIAARIEPRAPQAGMVAATAALATPAATADFPSLPGIGSAEGLKRMMNKPAFYQKMLKSFSRPLHRRAGDDSALTSRLAHRRRTTRRIPRRACRRRSAQSSARSGTVTGESNRRQANDVEAEIVAFGIALDVVLAGLRAQFGWTAAQ